MTKLEQLAMYLPYKLICLVDDKHKAEMNSVYSDGTCTFCDLVESEKGFKSIKPFLKPISEADRYIRTQFTQFIKHGKNDSNKVVIDLFCFEYIGTSDLLEDLDLLNLPFKSLKWLLENHYDVFGLIDKNEAVIKDF